MTKEYKLTVRRNGKIRMICQSFEDQYGTFKILSSNQLKTPLFEQSVDQVAQYFADAIAENEIRS